MNTINPETGEVTPRSVKAVAAKVAAAMADMEDYAPKDGQNKFHNYAYTSVSQYIAHVRAALVKHGLVIIPTLIKLTDLEDGITTDALMKYTIIDKDSGEFVETIMMGRGQDAATSKDGRRLDKGPYKAYSGAFKYFLSETFMIASGDDPDETSGQGQKATGAKSGQAQNTPKDTTSKNGTKGKVSEDPVTAFWLKAKELNVDTKQAQQILAGAQGNAQKALAVLEGVNQPSGAIEEIA